MDITFITIFIHVNCFVNEQYLKRLDHLLKVLLIIYVKDILLRLDNIDRNNSINNRAINA
jgi:hypothetical protein